MPVSKEEIDAQLKRLEGLEFNRNTVKKEIAYLPEIIERGEIIHAITSGSWKARSSLIVATKRRVLFICKGVLFGLEQAEVPLKEISAISHKIGIMYGELKISTSSGTHVIGDISKSNVSNFSRTLNNLIHNPQETIDRTQIETTENRYCPNCGH